MSPRLQNYFKFSPFFVNAGKMSDLEWTSWQDKIDKLSTELADFLVDSRVPELILEILRVKNLSDNVGLVIAAVIREVVVADIQLRDLPAAIVSRSGLAPEAAQEVSSLVSSKILSPILNKTKIAPTGNQIKKEVLPGAQYNPPPQSLHEQNVGNLVDLRVKK